MFKASRIFPVCLIFALILAGCSPAAPAPTATPLPLPSETATPIPPSATPTNTPLPTATSTPDARATRAAESTAQAAQAITKINDTLKAFELTTDEGQFGEMITKDIKLSTSSYGERNHRSFSDATYADFMLYTEITWKSSSGLAGCGIIFRAQDEKLEKEYYILNTLRLSGAPAWDVEYMKDGRYAANNAGKILFSNSINVGNGDTNAYLLVARGQNLTVYANGKKLSALQLPQLSDAGQVMAITFQESGETSCTFSNTWIWEYK